MNQVLFAAAAAIALTTAVPSEAQDYATVVPTQPEDGQIVRYSRGVPYVDVVRPAGVVRVMPVGIENGQLSFEVSFINLSRAATNFGAGNVSVAYRNANVRLLTYNELARRADRRRGFRSLLANLGAALQAGAQNTEYVNATVYGAYGQSASLSGTITRPLTGQQRLSIEAIRQDQVAGIEAHRNTSIARLDQSMLRTATVGPRMTHSGVVIVNRIRLTNQPQPVTVTVNWNGEIYSFPFTVER